jgi:hypothetical protein
MRRQWDSVSRKQDSSSSSVWRPPKRGSDDASSQSGDSTASSTAAERSALCAAVNAEPCDNPGSRMQNCERAASGSSKAFVEAMQQCVDKATNGCIDDYYDCQKSVIADLTPGFPNVPLVTECEGVRVEIMHRVPSMPSRRNLGVVRSAGPRAHPVGCREGDPRARRQPVRRATRDGEDRGRRAPRGREDCEHARPRPPQAAPRPVRAMQLADFLGLDPSSCCSAVVCCSYLPDRRNTGVG